MSATQQIPNMLLLLILAVCAHFSLGIIEETSIPVNMVGCFQKMSDPKLIPSHCMEYCLFQEGVNTISTLPGGVNITQEHPWFKGLQKKIKIEKSTKTDDKKKHQRKEYRYMTDGERKKWHQAVNMLKTDKAVYPNKYDALALLHATNAARTAFGGPSFLAWNRQYYALFEQACHEKIPGLVMPYWDVSLDSHLEDIRQSIIWSHDFLGSSEGPVIEGPFSDWQTPYGPLNRQIGNFGSFPSMQIIETILQKEHLGDILYPNAKPEDNLEYLMTSALNVIGGQVASFHSSAVDPAYFLICGYFDYLWSLFQEKQITKGISPHEDYPSFYGDLRYAPASPLEIVPITIQEALSPIYGNQRFVYHQVPECGGGCKSPHLACVNKRCVPKTRLSGCLNPLPARSFQNTFCVNGNCDISLWSYIPIRIVHKRAPNYPTYDSFAVQKGRLVTTKDIYDALHYSDSNQYFKSKTVSSNKPYNCRRSRCCGGVGGVQVTSTGMNYHGTYKDYALVDERLAVSTGETYIAVKNPKYGLSQSVIRAYDSCGRVCRPACRIPGSVPAAYAPCSGVVQLTSQQPFGYGDDLGMAYLNMYNFRVNPMLPPSTAESAVYLTFYCNVDLQWPFEEDSFNTMALLSPLFQNQQKLNTYSYPFADPKEPNKVCKVSFMCDIQIACGNCRLNGGKSSACNGKCGEYAECVFGQYQHRLCPGGYGFNAKTHQCDPNIKCAKVARAIANAHAVSGPGGSANAQSSASANGEASSNAMAEASQKATFARGSASLRVLASSHAAASSNVVVASPEHGVIASHSAAAAHVRHSVAISNADAAAGAASASAGASSGAGGAVAGASAGAAGARAGSAASSAGAASGSASAAAGSAGATSGSAGAVAGSAGASSGSTGTVDMAADSAGTAPSPVVSRCVVC